jgi:hypothetical protein
MGVAACWGGAVSLCGAEVAESTADIDWGRGFWGLHLTKSIASK